MDQVASKQQTFISPGSGGWQSEVRVPARLSSGSLPACTLRAFLRPHVAERREGKQAFRGPLDGHSSITRAPPS